MSKVNLAEMDKIGQLFDRQKGYLVQGQSFVTTNARPAGYTGLLSLLEGHYRSCYEAGSTGMGNGVQIAGKCATTIRANYAQYVADDRSAYESQNKLNKNAPPYEPPKGQLGPGGSRPDGGGPGAGKAVWDGTKWVTKGLKTGAEYGKDGYDGHNKWWNTKNMKGRLETAGKPLKDGSKLFGKDTKWAEDPWGAMKKKAAESAKDAQAKVLGYKDGKDWDKQQGQKFQDAYKAKSGEDLPTRPTAKQQHAVSTALDAAKKPGELVSAADGAYQAWKNAQEEWDRMQTINRLKGVDNTGSTTWAKDKGGTW